MFFSFKGENHFVYFKVVNNQMFVSNEKTNFVFKPLRLLFPSHVTTLLTRKAASMSKDDFKGYVVDEFKKMGYDLQAFSEGGLGDTVEAKKLTPVQEVKKVEG